MAFSAYAYCTSPAIRRAVSGGSSEWRETTDGPTCRKRRETTPPVSRRMVSLLRSAFLQGKSPPSERPLGLTVGVSLSPYLCLATMESRSTLAVRARQG
jgi:hypothetical protein